MNKIKKFKEDHADQIAIFQVGLGIGMIVSALYALRVVSGTKIDSADILTDNNGVETMLVYLKNGTKEVLKKTAEQ